jgi:aspartate carbamoyltransferase catalytic subunit
MDIRGQSIIEAQQFHPELLEELFERADDLQGKHSNRSILCGRRVAMLFYEASTRTRLSFETAVDDLGGTFLSTENAAEFSSAAKGERLEHTARMAAGYADAIVLRHPADNAAAVASDYLEKLRCHVPVINAGCGKLQHPTQALADLYTIRQLLGRMDNFSIAIVGDLAHARTSRSLAYLLAKFHGIRIRFVAPEELAIGRDITAYLTRHDVVYDESHDLAEVIGSVDFIYTTRVQQERFEKQEEYERIKGCFDFTRELVKKMKPGGKLLHPLPINGEVAAEVDFMSQAAYFQQADNGLSVRKALLEMIL